MDARRDKPHKSVRQSLFRCLCSIQLTLKKLLDDARIKNYPQRITQLIAKILEINPPDKAQIIFTPVARIIAEYGADYCIATRPLTITLTKP